MVQGLAGLVRPAAGQPRYREELRRKARSARSVRHRPLPSHIASVQAHLRSIFFPSSYDLQTTHRLPTLFTIHGGGFVIGDASDDDRWNRTFSDEHGALVISLNYAKAPFPAPLHDAACLFLACVEDPSLPIDAARVAVAGFSAGGNLALGLCQLQSVRAHAARPRAVVPIYPAIDASRSPEEKARRRHYKVDSSFSGVRGEDRDWVHPLAELFDWTYIPAGTKLQHPLLSPLYVDKNVLPGYIFVIAAELDYLADEARHLAFRVAGKQLDPSYDDIPGRPEASKEEGKLELEDPRFAWEEEGVKWLLVPDVVHAFDFHVGAVVAGEGAVGDAEAKTRAYMGVLAEWLNRTVWGSS